MQTTGRPFNQVVLSRSEGVITETITKSRAQVYQLRSFFLLGGCGSYKQHLGAGKKNGVTSAVGI